MTVAECIRQEFSMVGTISDYGVRRFAREWGYIDSLIMHPLSVSENGHSASWSESAMKQRAQLMLRQYGITPGEELSSSIGLSSIKDASNLW